MAREQPQVFVAYPYSFPADDYREVFNSIRDDFGVEFVFADEQITNKHILVKIVGMIEAAAFSLFDITTWNPNVALELGVAVGAELDYYILFNPAQGDEGVPADLGGIDRIQYSSYSELREGLARLMTQQFGAPEAEEDRPQAGGEVSVQLDSLRGEIPNVLREEPGMQIGGVASAIGVPLEYAQVLVRPLVGDAIVTRGAKRGTRYYLPENAPPDDEDAE
jgi:hypothetical protein